MSDKYRTDLEVLFVLSKQTDTSEHHNGIRTDDRTEKEASYEKHIDHNIEQKEREHDRSNLSAEAQGDKRDEMVR